MWFLERLRICVLYYTNLFFVFLAIIALIDRTVSRFVRTLMYDDAIAFVETPNGCGNKAHINVLFEISMRHAVIVHRKLFDAFGELSRTPD